MTQKKLYKIKSFFQLSFVCVLGPFENMDAYAKPVFLVVVVQKCLLSRGGGGVFTSVRLHASVLLMEVED